MARAMRPTVARDLELARLERVAQRRPLTLREENRLAELSFRTQALGGRLYVPRLPRI